MPSPINAPKLQDSESSSSAKNWEKERVAAGYDNVASQYDSQLAQAQWIRQRLWQRMDLLFPQGSTVLDVTAGTGLDALHLAKRGVSVVACDISNGMLEHLRAKDPNIKTHVIDFNKLELDGEFDGVIATFAGLNTSADLRPFARSTAQLLRSGGILFIHLLNRWPLLDITRQLAGLHLLNAWRIITSGKQYVDLGGILVPHYLYSPLSLYRRVFKPYFRMGRISGQGIIRPLEASWGTRLEQMERQWESRFPFHSLGTFFSIEMSRI